ncbi:MAG: hypothetical protein ABSG45_07655 [Nitrososphaerales archaeon]
MVEPPGAFALSHTTGQTWAALKKSWKAYKIAKVKDEKENMVEYAKRIRSLQKELGVTQAKFPELDLG